MTEAYDGRQVVGIDLHRRRSVIVRMTEDGRKLETVRITNSPATSWLPPRSPLRIDDGLLAGREATLRATPPVPSCARVLVTATGPGSRRGGHRGEASVLPGLLRPGSP